jgi:hypothetical protein
VSWWVYLNSKRSIEHGRDPNADCDVECYCFEDQAFEQNVTYNLGGMFRQALGRGLDEFDGAPAVEAAGILRQGVRDMEDRPDFYKAMNPPNGWGSYEGARQFLRDLGDACADHPDLWIRVS